MENFIIHLQCSYLCCSQHIYVVVISLADYSKPSQTETRAWAKRVQAESKQDSEA